MSDISKCQNGCSRQLLCKRYTVPAHQFRQSYMDFKPDPVTGICADYMPNAVAMARDIEVDRQLINHNED